MIKKIINFIVKKWEQQQAEGEWHIKMHTYMDSTYLSFKIIKHELTINCVSKKTDFTVERQKPHIGSDLSLNQR